MSPVIKETSEFFKRTSEQSDQMERKAKPLDGELSIKIKRVKESADAVVEHIKKRSGDAQHGG